jgi:hypothetical protein
MRMLVTLEFAHRAPELKLRDKPIRVPRGVLRERVDATWKSRSTARAA